MKIGQGVCRNREWRRQTNEIQILDLNWDHRLELLGQFRLKRMCCLPKFAAPRCLRGRETVFNADCDRSIRNSAPCLGLPPIATDVEEIRDIEAMTKKYKGRLTRLQKVIPFCVITAMTFTWAQRTGLYPMLFCAKTWTQILHANGTQHITFLTISYLKY